MSFPPQHPFGTRGDPRVEHAAAEWIARRYQGLSPAQEAEFERWLRADSRHAAVFHELEEVWRELDRVRLPAADRLGPPDPNVLAPPRLRFRRFVPLLAAAAAVAVAWLGWTSLAPTAVESGRNEVTAEAIAYTGVVATEVGHLEKLALPDGSVVRVNTDSRVEVAYSTGERRVRLVRGEAHFTVAKDATRPFVVDVAGVAVRAVGTAFNVRLRPEAVEVLVTEGRVRVADVARNESQLAPRAGTGVAVEPPVVQAGERVVIPAVIPPDAPRVPLPVARLAVPEIERMLAWQDRRIELVSAPLGDLVAEFNRYNRAKLVVGDPALGDRRFGGSFRADDPETFVRLLETRFGLHVERSGETTVLRAGK